MWRPEGATRFGFQQRRQARHIIYMQHGNGCGYCFYLPMLAFLTTIIYLWALPRAQRRPSCWITPIHTFIFLLCHLLFPFRRKYNYNYWWFGGMVSIWGRLAKVVYLWGHIPLWGSVDWIDAWLHFQSNEAAEKLIIHLEISLIYPILDRRDTNRYPYIKCRYSLLDGQCTQTISTTLCLAPPNNHNYQQLATHAPSVTHMLTANNKQTLT